MTKKKVPDAAKALGLFDGQVVAVRMTNGECPIGVVIAMNDDYFTLHLFSWFTEMFSGDAMDVAYGLVDSVRTTTYTQEGDRRVYQMDRLGAWQTEWAKLYDSKTKAE